MIHEDTWKLRVRKRLVEGGIHSTHNSVGNIEECENYWRELNAKYLKNRKVDIPSSIIVGFMLLSY